MELANKKPAANSDTTMPTYQELRKALASAKQVQRMLRENMRARPVRGLELLPDLERADKAVAEAKAALIEFGARKV